MPPETSPRTFAAPGSALSGTERDGETHPKGCGKRGEVQMQLPWFKCVIVSAFARIAYNMEVTRLHI
jgi:hypothetical protein